MRLIKLLLFSLVVLSGVVLTMSLFIPSHIRISRAIDIKAGYGEIHQQLANTGEWKHWLLPPGDSGISIRYSSDSLSVFLNDNRITIGEVSPGEVITEMQSPGNRRIISGWKLLELNRQDSVTVQWYMDFSLKWYPWEKFRSLLFDKIYGSQMERGLAALKAYSENHSSQN